MLDEYKNCDYIIYRQMKNALKNGLSHAYLFNINNNIYAEDMILSFVKSILCGSHNTKEEYDKCHLCARIDNDTFPELKKIIPDGMYIKKDQLDELQKKFSTKPIESQKKIYIIYEAEKFNLASANSLLKFLEEPADDIIAILLTNNLNQVLKTIVSRCQVLNFKKNSIQEFIKINNIVENKTIYKLSFTVFGISNLDSIEEYHKNFFKSVLDFILYYENNGKKSIVYEKEKFLDMFKEKEEVINFFECSILFYNDVINFKLQRELLYYDDYIDLIKIVSEKNSLENLLKKINILLNKQKLVRNNVNINMLVDSLIIDMEE